LAVLTEQPLEWAVVVQDLQRATAAHRGDRVDGATELLLWQTLAACWELPAAATAPLTAQRLDRYLLQAVRVAKSSTTWTAPDDGCERQVLALGRASLGSPAVGGILAGGTRRTFAAQPAAALGLDLGNETVDLALVDPDNRRDVDHAAHRERLTRMIAGAGPDGIADEKLWLTHRALVLRRERPELFQGRDAAYRPLPTTTGHAVA